MSAKRYFKFDESDGYLENEADINYFIVNQARRVAFGNMLGDYNEDGIYVIDEKIVKELIMMPKIVVDSVDGADLIRGAIRFDGFVHFMLNIEEDKAKLILLEKINFESNVKYNVGRYSNMNEYVLGEVSVPDRDIDKNIIYAKFNILREDDGKYYDFRDLTEKELENFSNLIGKMKRNLVVQNDMYDNEKAIEVAEADYFDNILSAFSKHSKLKVEFERFLKTIILDKQKFIQINKPFFQKTMNEILDGAVLVFLSKLPPEVREVIEEEIRKAKEKYFYDFTKLIHLQFISNSSLQVEAGENIINDIMIDKKTPSKISQFEVEEKKLENSFGEVVKENEEIKNKALSKNASKKDIVEDNPALTKFFGEIKKETGDDLLKSSKQTEEKKSANSLLNSTLIKSAKKMEANPKVATPTKKVGAVVGTVEKTDKKQEAKVNEKNAELITKKIEKGNSNSVGELKNTNVKKTKTATSHTLSGASGGGTTTDSSNAPTLADDFMSGLTGEH